MCRRHLPRSSAGVQAHPSQKSAQPSNSALPSSTHMQPASADGTSRALTTASLGSCNSTLTGGNGDHLSHLAGSSLRPARASSAHPSSHAHMPHPQQAPYASHALPDSTSAPPTSQGSAMSDLPCVREERTSPCQQRHTALHLTRVATAAATAHLLSSSAFSLEVASQRSTDNWHMAAGDGSLHAASAAASVFPPSQGSNPTAPLSPPESASCPSSRRPSGAGLAAFPGLQQMQVDGAPRRQHGYRGVDPGCALSAPSSAASGQGQHIGDLSAAALRAGLTQRCGVNAATAAWVSAATQEQLVDLAGDYLRSCGPAASGAGSGRQSGEAAQLAAVLQTLQQRGSAEEAAAAAAALAAAGSGGAAAPSAAASVAGPADSMRQAAAQAAHMRTASKSSCRNGGRGGNGLVGGPDDPRRYLWDSTDKQSPLDFMMDSPSTEVSLKASEGPPSTQHAPCTHGASADGCALLPTMSGGTMWDIHPDSLTSGYTPRAAAAAANGRAAGAAQLRAARADAGHVATESVPVDICMTGEGSMMGGVEEVVAAIQQSRSGQPASSLGGPSGQMQLENVVAMCGIEEVPNASAMLEGALDALHAGGAVAGCSHAGLPNIE